MKRVNILTILSLAFFSLNLNASEIYDGVLLNRSSVSMADLANISSVNYGLSTARSSAMGGAFTSLGADLSSMSINPAGLGMYKSSDVSISYNYNSVSTSNQTTNGYYDNNTESSNSLNNFGLAYNLYYNNKRAVSSITLGFAYNKLADFTSSYGVASENNTNSITEIFANQISGLDPSTLGTDADAFNTYGTNLWGAILAYQVGASDYTDIDYLTSHYLKTVSSGGVDEYSFSAGFNIKDYVFIGASLAFQSVKYRQSMYYDESYEDGATDLNYLLYDQSIYYAGSGMDFKLGITVMPIDNLRIGLAVHTGATISLNTYYSASITADYDQSEEYDAETLYEQSLTAVSTLKYSTPTRLLIGASYLFSDSFLVALDYERVWYNGMSSDFAEDFSSQFTTGNNFKVGLEYMPNDRLSIRAGGAYYGNSILDQTSVLSQPTAYTGYNLSAGIGYRFSKFYIDLTYVYAKSTYTSFDFYYYENGNPEDTITSPSNDYISYSTNSSIITCTVGYRF